MKKATFQNTKVLCTFILTVCILLSQSACGFISFNTGKDTVPKETEINKDTDKSKDKDTSPDAEVTKKDYNAIARKRLEALTDVDFNSSAIIIATHDSSTVCPVVDNESPTIAARADCQLAVEEKLGTKIITNVSDGAALLEEARAAYKSDMYFADLIAIPAYMLGSFYSEGILANMYSLPYVDYDAPYYNSEFISNALAGSALPAVSGAANFNPDYLNCIYFNREILETLSTENIYKTVASGEFTVDKFRELTLAAKSAKISGHASFFSISDYIDVSASAQGLIYTSLSTQEKAPEINYMDNSYKQVFENFVGVMRNLIYKDKSFYNKNSESARQTFEKGTLLFINDTLDYMKEISNHEIEWGILPMPKYNLSQSEYISPLTDDTPIFCVLGNTPSYSTSGIVLEALNITAYEYTELIYKEEAANYYLRDSGSINMIDTIIDGAKFDFSHLYASGINGLENATYGAVSSAVINNSSISYLYRARKSAANRAITSKIKIYT